ncbi:pentapeptide repeat-containing protein [Methylobacterium sp. CM6247]
MSELGISFSSGGEENRVLTFKTADFFKSASKFLIKMAAGSYTDALAELPDVGASIGVTTSPQERVGNLITRAIQRALKIILTDIVNESSNISSDVYAASFIGLSENTIISVDNDFLSNPNKMNIIPILQNDIIHWLTAIDTPSNDIKNVMTRLPSVFTRCLHDEWRSNPTYYKEILEAIESPFIGAAVLEQDWNRYRSYLNSVVNERVFDETFGLAQIFIPPRCFYNKRQDSADRTLRFSDAKTHRSDPIRIIDWAEREINHWISKEDKDFSIRVIAGGPGSGKSSFAKILAAKLAHETRKVLFVPLHQIDLESGLVRAVADFFKQAGHFGTDPLTEDGQKPLVLILDGLDEIQLQGKAAQESAQGFVNELIRYVERVNTIHCRLLCLITGRDLAVQSADSAFRTEGQVIHLVPYSLAAESRANFTDRDDLFSLDQRDEWWKKYGELTGLNYDCMPDNLRKGEMNEVTSQPLLNYLVALAHRRGLKLDETTNINSVYGDLLQAVYVRGWARNNHPSVKDVPYQSFVRLLEEVALAVWHGAGRTTTIAEVELHCQQSKVGALLPSFESGISSGVSSLLLAFYFRQKGRRDNGEKTFEFTHKTFAEYLISLRVVRLVELVCSQLAAHQVNPDFGLDEQDALFRWLNICGKATLDNYLLDFIRREIAFRDRQSALALQVGLTSMLDASLVLGWPVQRLERLNFLEQKQHARNAEETLVACIHACAIISKEKTMVSWPSETAAGEMLKRLQGQRKGPNNKPIMSCLAYISFCDQYLDMADLFNANLENCDFSGAELNYACLMRAKLSNAIFIGAAIDGAYLSSAELDGTKFSISLVRNIRRGLRSRKGPIALDLDELGDRMPTGYQDVHTFARALLKKGALVIHPTGHIMELDEITQYLVEQNKSKGNNELKIANNE